MRISAPKRRRKLSNSRSSLRGIGLLRDIEIKGRRAGKHWAGVTTRPFLLLRPTHGCYVTHISLGFSPWDEWMMIFCRRRRASPPFFGRGGGVVFLGTSHVPFISDL